MSIFYEVHVTLPLSCMLCDNYLDTCLEKYNGYMDDVMFVFLYGHSFVHIFSFLHQHADLSINSLQLAVWLHSTLQDNPFTAISSDPETSSSEKGDRNGYRDDKPQHLHSIYGRPVATAKAKRWSR